MLLLKKLIISVIVLVCLLCVFLVSIVIDIPLKSTKYSNDVFDAYFYKDQIGNLSDIEVISVYKCSQKGWWSVDRLEEICPTPMIMSDIKRIERLIDDLHFPGKRPTLSSNGFIDLYHVIVKTNAGERGYVRVMLSNSNWYVKGANTIYRINEPKWLISAMDALTNEDSKDGL